MKKKYKILFFLIGLAGFVFLMFQTDVEEEDWQMLLTPMLPVLILGLLLLWAVIYLLHMYSYRFIIGPEAAKIKTVQLYRICVAGFALNEVTPLGLVGGEPFRIMELKHYFGIKKATSVTLTFSVLYIFGHILLWITAIVIYGCLGFPGETVTTVLLLIAFALMMAACFAFFNQKSNGFILPLLRRLSAIPFLKKPVGSLMEKRGEEIKQIDSSYVGFRKKSDRFYKAILCEYAARILESMEYFFIFRYLGVHISVFGAILILGMGSLIGNLLFMIPMQTGTREGGTALAVDWLGMDPAVGMMGGLLYRVRYILCILIGTVFILAGKEHKAEGSQ